MYAKILGLQEMDFVAKDGNQIKGTSLHACFEDERVRGYAVEKFFVRADGPVKLPVGLTANSNVDLSFNRKGKLDAIRFSASPPQPNQAPQQTTPSQQATSAPASATASGIGAVVKDVAVEAAKAVIGEAAKQGGVAQMNSFGGNK